MRRVVWGMVWSLCLIGGAASGVKMRASAAGPEVAREFVPPPPAQVPMDLPKPQLEIYFEPRAVLQQHEGEALELALAFQSNFEKVASVQYGYELVDDEGRRIQETQLSQIQRLEAAHPLQSKIVTPAGLKDGFYRVRVTAAASDGEEGISTGAERYFRVKGGSTTPLSPTEFFGKSHANRAHRAEEK